MFPPVDDWRATLVSALVAEDAVDLVDAERIDAIRALEQLVCTATAAQAQLAAELDRSQRAAQAGAGVPAARQGQGVAAQVAWARRESPQRGQRHLGLARIVADELPHTWAAWREGRVTEWAAVLVARETVCLSLEDRLAVDELVAGDADRFEAMGPREVGSRAAAEAARLDPASVVARRRRAEADRHVTLRPAPDTMTWLTALLPVKDGVGLFAELSRTADTTRGAGDVRSRGQVMADVLVSRVLAGDEVPGPTPPPRVTLGLVMSDTALLGGDDDPAHLEGYGTVPAELARELVAGTLSAGEAVEVRRLWTSPTGELVAMDSRSRLFRGLLARFVRLRDQVCRTPWCGAPVRHVDHVEDHAAGGPTSAANAQGLCESCNHAKQALGWRARPGPDSSVLTTLPTGQSHRTRPPPLVTVRRCPVTVDFVLAG